MNKVSSRQERYNYYNYVTGIVKMVEGHKTKIDLQNESSITGIIANVDGYMNIDLVEAILTDTRGKEHTFSNYYLQARNIRYVHIPEEIDMTNIDPLVTLFYRKRHKPKRTFKEVRALKVHKETLDDLAGSSKSSL